MIDSSKSPVPLWKRNLTLALIAVLVVIAAFVIYTKELHKTSSSSASGGQPASTAPAPVNRAATSAATVPTTIPGGVPASLRNPFGA